MKTKIILSVIIFCFFGHLKGQNIPNNSFENWINIGGWFDNPDFWMTNNSQIVVPVVKDTNAYDGNFAVKLNTIGIRPYVRSKFVFHAHPLLIEAFVKSNILSGDSVDIHVKIYAGGNLVDSGRWTSTTSINGWTLQQIPVTMNNPFTDSLEIIIMGGHQTGTTLSVDAMSAVTTGIDLHNAELHYTLFPQPASKKAKLEFDNRAHENFSFTLYNCKGQSVQNINYITDNHIKLDLSSFRGGLYLFRLSTNNKQAFGKLIIQ
jgi:hypothetical protein